MSRPLSAPPSNNLIALATSRVVLILSAMWIQAIIARHLSIAQYGTMATLLTVMALVRFLANLNIGYYLTREIARDARSTPHLVGTALATLSVSAFVAGLLVVAWGALSSDPQLLPIASIAAVSLWFESLQVAPSATFQGLRRMSLQLPISLLERSLLVGVTWALLSRGLEIRGIFAAKSLAAAVALALGLYVSSGISGRPRVRFRLSEQWSMVRAAGPFALNSILAIVYLSTDILVVHFFHGDAAVGRYQAGALIPIQLGELTLVLTMGLYPLMATSADDPEAIGRHLSFGTRVLQAIGIPAAVGGMLTAGPLLEIFLGPDYAVATPLLVAMLPLVPIRYAKNLAAVALTACNRQPRRTRGVAWAALLNLVANLVVVPRHGALGAVGTTLATEIFLVLYFGRSLAPHIVDVRWTGPLARILFATTIMASVVYSIGFLHVFLRIGIGAIVYGVAALAIGAIHLSDLRTLRSI